jgi:hypothetical protein
MFAVLLTAILTSFLLAGAGHHAPRVAAGHSVVVLDDGGTGTDSGGGLTGGGPPG